jgi:hypothetical protein
LSFTTTLILEGGQKSVRKKISNIIAIFQKKGVRRMILVTILVVDLVLIIAVFLWGGILSNERVQTAIPLLESLRAKSSFTTPEWVALITPGLAILMALFAHWRDEASHGQGVKDIIKRVVGKNPYNLEADVMSASMTKQSVLVAIAAALMAVIQLYPKAPATEYWTLVKELSTFGFAFAILFLLVSMVCYDYASRFRWPTVYKAQLVHKALLLDVLSWYFLLTSFILTIALISPRLSILMSIVSGVLMWWYYFFPRGGPGDTLGIRGISKHVIKVNDLDKALKFYSEKLGLEVCEREEMQQSLRIGSWTEIILLKESSANPQPIALAFTMSEDDLQYAVKSLREMNIDITTEPPEVNDKIKVQRIRLKDPVNQHSIELSAPKQNSHK